MFAYVAHYSAPASYFRVIHQGKPEAFGPYQPLKIGDRVVVLRSSYRDGRSNKPAVIYVRIDNALYPVDSAHSPLCIGEAAAGCGRVVHATQPRGAILTGLFNLYAMIASKFRVAQEYDTRRHSATMSMRGGSEAPLVLPILSSVAAQQIDGHGFAIGWLGGTAPFSVTISRDSKTIESQRAAQRNLRLRDETLPAGDYSIRIRDAKGRSTQGAFHVTAASPNAAECPNEAKQAGSCADLQAGMLLKRGSAWHLAAYQRLAFSQRLTEPGRAMLRWLNEVPP